MFSKNTIVWVYKDDELQEISINDVKIGDLVLTVNSCFRPVIKTEVRASSCGLLISEHSHKLWCYYGTLFFGYDQLGTESKQLRANEMVGFYWKRYDEYHPNRFIFDKVVDWRPCYERTFKKDHGKPSLLLENMYSLVVDGDHSYFANDIAVYDNVFDNRLDF